MSQAFCNIVEKTPLAAQIKREKANNFYNYWPKSQRTRIFECGIFIIWMVFFYKTMSQSQDIFRLGNKTLHSTGRPVYPKC